MSKRTTAALPLLSLTAALCLWACQSEPPAQTSPPGTELESTSVVATPSQANPKSQPKPPTPPIIEDFEGQPQLSLFPRIGDYRPEADSERLPYWSSFIKHVQKASGLAQVEQGGHESRVYGFRSINTLDSIGFFSPIAVSPETSYRVFFRMHADLPEGASAGVGVLEFDRFYWIGEQPPESFSREHQRGLHEGVQLTGTIDWQEQSFEFTTGSDTGMIHLVIYREGPHNRVPVLVDDIVVMEKK